MRSDCVALKNMFNFLAQCRTREILVYLIVSCIYPEDYTNTCATVKIAGVVTQLVASLLAISRSTSGAVCTAWGILSAAFAATGVVISFVWMKTLL
jgi:hypothetical protein